MIKIKHIEGHKFEATNGKEILVIDSIGHTPIKIIKDDPFLLNEAFPIENKEFHKKTKLIIGDIEELLPFYHSFDDTMEKVKYIEWEKVLKIINL